MLTRYQEEYDHGFENNAIGYCKENKKSFYRVEKDQQQYRLNKIAILDFVHNHRKEGADAPSPCSFG